MATFSDILKLTKQLFPTGRAWRLSDNSKIRKLFYALGKSESRAINAALSSLNRILPDNTNFTAQDCTEWERRLNIIVSGYLPLETRKATILRKYQFPGGFLNRQNYRYIQAQLQLAGYAVTVTENSSPIGAGVSATVHKLTTKHGTSVHGGTISTYETLANSIDNGEVFNIDTYLGVFYIDGQIPANAIRAFRLLVLSLKPVNTVALLRLTYTNKRELVYMSGNGIYFINGMRLALVK